MVRYAKNSDLPELIQIWQQSFGDSEEYIQMFLRENFDYIKTIVYENEGVPVSVAYLFPIDYIDERGKIHNFFYLYAAATRENARKKGYFTSIVRWILKNISSNIILVPANENLTAYYKKIGFRCWLSGEERIFEQIKSNVIYSIEETNSEEYISHRDNNFCKVAYMRWNERVMKYILHENENSGGFCKKIVINSRQYCVMCRKMGEELQILELLPLTDEKCMVADCLLNEFNMQRVRVCICPQVLTLDQNILKENIGYFNLFMG